MARLVSKYRLLGRVCVLVGVLAATVWTMQAQEKCTQVPVERPRNRKIIISDLHLGAGRQADGRWSALEDFRFPEALRSFLGQITNSGNTDLIIAGDFIDFWQILPELEQKRIPELGATEQESLQKLEVALTRHRETFADLRAFAQVGKNKLIIIPGNHDVDLLWPQVQSRLQRELGLPLNQKLFFTNNCYESEGVHVEHGHQYDQANRFKNANAPFVMDDNRLRRLETNWGTTFMSRFYNDVEHKWPFIDNLAPEVAAIAWAMQSESTSSLTKAAQLGIMLLKDQKALANLRLIKSTLGSAQPPKQVPPKTVDNLLKLYEAADPELAKMLRATVQTEAARQEAENALKEITPEEWSAAQAGFERIEPTETLENQLSGKDPYIQAAGQIVIRKPEISIVVMAHTHDLDRDVVPLDGFGQRNKWYVNTGCWQKLLKVQTAKQRGKLWSKLSLDDPIFTLRFSYVLITYDGDNVMRPTRSFWMG